MQSEHTRPRLDAGGEAPIAAIVLAAGRSTRMGAANKLLADLGGRPMVRWVAEAALASRAHQLIAVVGHQADAVRAALAGLDVLMVENPDYATGLAGSLQAGIRAVPAACAGALVLLGDMPRVSPAQIDVLIAAYVPGGIVVPTHQGRRGNPVLWASTYFPEMLQLDGDAGARRLLVAHGDRVREVEIDSDAIFLDVDTPDALAALRAERGKA